jgi:hypothetical protein
MMATSPVDPGLRIAKEQRDCAAGVLIAMLYDRGTHRDPDSRGYARGFRLALSCEEGVCGESALFGIDNREPADLDGDGDVDGFDFLTFSNCYNGSSRPPLCP